MSKARELADSYTDSEVDALDTSLQTALETYSDDNSIGVGQTWQNVTASRSSGVTYTNTTGKPIMVTAQAKNSVTGSVVITGYVDSVSVGGSAVYGSGAGYKARTSFVVPAGSTYSATIGGSGGVSLNVWSELR